MTKTPEELQGEIDALKAHNTKLIGEKRDAAAKVTEAEEARKAAEEKADAERAENLKKETDVNKVRAEYESKIAKMTGDHDKQISTLSGARDRLMIDGGLLAALDGAKVKPEFKEAAVAMLRAKGVEVKVESGEFAAYLGGKPLAEAVTEWATSESGKHFVLNENSGGGAPGNNGRKSPNKGGNPYTKDSLNLTEQGRLEKEDPQRAEKLRAEAA